MSTCQHAEHTIHIAVTEIHDVLFVARICYFNSIPTVYVLLIALKTSYKSYLMSIGHNFNVYVVCGREQRTTFTMVESRTLGLKFLNKIF